MSDGNKITVFADGPFELSGDVKVKKQDGTPIATDETVYLCRCGASKNQPFCDGSHSAIDFEDPGVIAGGKLVGTAEAGALEVTTATHGPLLISGPVTLQTADGATCEGARAALCRCGASSTKPFCDGQHKDAGFCAE